MTYSYKKLYTYECKQCGKPRTTTKEEKVAEALCGPCRALQMPPGSPTLFDQIAGGGGINLWRVFKTLWQKNNSRLSFGA